MEELAMLYWKHFGSFRLSYHRMSDADHLVYSDLYHMDRRDATVRQKVFILDFGTKSATTRVMKMVRKKILYELKLCKNRTLLFTFHRIHDKDVFQVKFIFFKQMIDSGMNRNGYHIIIGGFVSIQLSCIYQ